MCMAVVGWASVTDLLSLGLDVRYAGLQIDSFYSYAMEIFFEHLFLYDFPRTVAYV